MKQLRDTKVLTTSAMLLAIAVILGFFKIPVSDVVEIRLQFLPVACAGMLFGPAVGGITGGLTDVLSFLVKPTGPFFPGFTITAVLQGVLYGVILGKKEPTLKRIITAQLLDSIIIGLVMNSICLSLLYGQGVIAVIGARVIKTLIMLPINILLLVAVTKGVRAINKRISGKA
ncbi:MAG: folate family ECF transporter S component [Lachnospiraceae bacterium]|nr:folate family ECF transporter S component [Lachnospiraceae bacterium]